MHILKFSATDFYSLCDALGGGDPLLQGILNEYGYPPLWTRPNSFETLVLTILEQQVSLASAYAAYQKVKERLLVITPEGIRLLTDEDLRACYLSRQKIVYVRGLAEAVLCNQIDLKSFESKDDDAVRSELILLKGIGHWTIDIYLLHALQRADLFPVGDVALVNAVRMCTGEVRSKEELLLFSERWKPYRSIATMIFWHYYIKKKNIKLLH